MSPGLEAATYYVAKTGNNNNAGTLTAPWLTIAKALSTASGGDTIYVRAGTYSEGRIWRRRRTRSSIGGCVENRLAIPPPEKGFTM